MKAGIYNFDNLHRGDSLAATTFSMKTSADSLPIDLTGADIKVAFRYEGILIEKNIGSGVTVDDASTGVFILDSFEFADIGKYKYDIEITFTDGTITTFVKGFIKVIKDVI